MRGRESRLPLDTTNYSITVLDAILANFQPDCIWPNDAGTSQSAGKKVIASSAAIKCLATCLEILDQLPEGDIKRRRSAETLVQQVDRVLGWLYCESYWIRRTFQPNNEAILVAPICSCLRNLIALDPELAECVFFSTTATQLTFRLYTMRFPYPGNKQRVSVIRNSIHEGHDPAEVVAMYLRHDRGREVITQALFASSTLREAFASSFIDRLDQLTEPCDHPVFTDPLDKAMLPITSATFIAIPLSMIRQTHALLQKHDYLRKWSKTIATLCESSTQPHAIFSMATDLFRLASGCAGHTVRAVADVIDGGILIPFFKALLQPRSEAESISNIECTINNLVEYTHHRRTAIALRKVFNALPDQLQRRIRAHKRVGGMFWRLRTALDRLSEHHLGLGMGGVTRICDNLVHPSEKDATYNIFNPPPPHKTCSTCHLVVYCSTECQREDWANRHRQECREASREYQVSRLTGRRYFFSARLFHIEYISTVVAKSLFDPTVKPTLKDGSVFLHHNGVQDKVATVKFMDTTVPDPEHCRIVAVYEFSIDEYMKRRPSGDCDAMEIRVKQLVQLFRTRCLGDSAPSAIASNGGNVGVKQKPRLLEAIFTHGVGVYVSVVAYVENRQDRWVVMQSVARILRVRGSPL
ncbi:hypothetical protein BKA70DRAFT_1296159 [Coprinopsis sp. MPI-PUGE-AT-0042]|nr:hypothetical protein BKA70DRAFT_1296159 [Coprinopsis sp. MPI-PUGE-AT-0042]